MSWVATKMCIVALFIPEQRISWHLTPEVSGPRLVSFSQFNFLRTALELPCQGGCGRLFAFLFYGSAWWMGHHKYGDKEEDSWTPGQGCQTEGCQTWGEEWGSFRLICCFLPPMVAPCWEDLPLASTIWGHFTCWTEDLPTVWENCQLCQGLKNKQ